HSLHVAGGGAVCPFFSPLSPLAAGSPLVRAAHCRLAAAPRHSPSCPPPRCRLYPALFLCVPGGGASAVGQIAAHCHNGDPAHLVNTFASTGASCNGEVKSLSYCGDNAMESACHVA